MTTFTRIEEIETPTIDIDVQRRLSKIDDHIYGGFLESVSHPFNTSCMHTDMVIDIWAGNGIDSTFSLRSSSSHVQQMYLRRHL